MELEHRVVALERRVDSMDQHLLKMANELADVAKDVKSLIEVKVKIEGLAVLFKKDEVAAVKAHATEVALAKLLAEHNICFADRTENEVALAGINVRINNNDLLVSGIKQRVETIENKHNTESSWWATRIGIFVDKLIPVVITVVIMVLMAKGGMFR